MPKKTTRKPSSHAVPPERTDDDHFARVAILVETSHSYGQEIYRGITRYIRENEPWSVFFVERGIGEGVPKWLKKWSGDGIITRVSTPDIVKLVTEKAIPAVDLDQQLKDVGVPQISNDHAAIGRMAADHLLQRGFKQFGYLGHNGLPWSDGRRDAFVEAVADADCSCDVYSSGSQMLRRYFDQTWELEMDQVVEWIGGLEKPVGVLTCNDFRGLQLIEACAVARIHVPQEVGILGVGNDKISCDLANPPLSSVLLNAFQAGYEAAAVLDRLMQGKPVDFKERLMPPLEVVTRQSTNVMAVADPIVSKAMQFIQRHACNGIKIPDVIRHVLVSHTVLQERFRKALNRSVHDMILDARIERIKELLAHTELPLIDIAERTGFKHVQYLSAVFKRETGWTPATFRKQHGQESQGWFQIEK